MKIHYRLQDARRQWVLVDITRGGVRVSDEYNQNLYLACRFYRRGSWRTVEQWLAAMRAYRL